MKADQEMCIVRWDFQVDQADQRDLLNAVDAHYAALSNRFGYTIDPNASVLFDVARCLIQKKQFPEALAVLKHAADLYPEVDYLQEHLGAALERAGQFEEALRAYRQALRLMIEGEHPYSDLVSDYARHVAEMENKLKK